MERGPGACGTLLFFGVDYSDDLLLNGEIVATALQTQSG